MSLVVEPSVVSHSYHVLVVDDDDRIRDLLGKFLTKNGFTVSLARDVLETAAVLRAVQVDMIILDIMLPGTSGLEYLKTLRSTSYVPVLMLSALGDAGSKLEGLSEGADDYITKPFDPQELILRIRNILQRGRISSEPVIQNYEKVKWGEMLFCLRSKKLWFRDVQVMLSNSELQLLLALTQNLGNIVSRENLGTCAANERSMDVQITRLRQKIEPNPKLPIYLKTVRGKGYYLDAEPVL